MLLQGFCLKGLTWAQLLAPRGTMTLAKALSYLIEGQTDYQSGQFYEHDSASPATLGTGGIVLENQDVGRDV
jgi:hypothetical protein